jgi:hypothetical protein
VHGATARTPDRVAVASGLAGAVHGTPSPKGSLTRPIIYGASVSPARALADAHVAAARTPDRGAHETPKRQLFRV